jgi:L-lactate dehydrogenase (cytochrome)
MLYGLGAMGQAGVTKALEIIRKELDLTMAFCGHTDIRQVGPDVLRPARRVEPGAPVALRRAA